MTPFQGKADPAVHARAQLRSRDELLALREPAFDTARAAPGAEAAG